MSLTDRDAGRPAPRMGETLAGIWKAGMARKPIIDEVALGDLAGGSWKAP
ncbi:hypothetical protein V5F59_00480 [Xanthobacter autotrophicus DSM 431]